MNWKKQSSVLGMAVAVMLLGAGQSVLAKRSYEKCWNDCFDKTCRRAAKFYKQKEMWSRTEQCLDQCKKNCKVFNKKASKTSS